MHLLSLLVISNIFPKQPCTTNYKKLFFFMVIQKYKPPIKCIYLLKQFTIFKKGNGVPKKLYKKFLNI